MRQEDLALKRHSRMLSAGIFRTQVSDAKDLRVKPEDDGLDKPEDDR